jgi:uncharacterized protein YkwD
MRMRIVRLLLLLLVGSIVAPAALPVAAAPGSGSTSATVAEISASQYTPDDRECAMLAKINAYRKSKGKSALKLSRTLGAAAEHHSKEMATKNYASHTLLGGVSWSQNMTNHGYPTNTYRGENIAAGNSAVADTLAQWKNSPGHNETMLSSDYKAIGIGFASNSKSDYRWYWTATFGSSTDRTVAC